MRDLPAAVLRRLEAGAPKRVHHRIAECRMRRGIHDHAFHPHASGRVADTTDDGWDAMMKGEDRIVSGWKNKLQVAASGVVPVGVLAEQHRKMAEPGSAE